MQKQLSTHRSGSSRTSRRYEQPTISSKSRSPSPYTNRRMCELTEDPRQRLAHLHLGPYEFKKETCSKPPFVVRHRRARPPTLPCCRLLQKLSDRKKNLQDCKLIPLRSAASPPVVAGFQTDLRASANWKETHERVRSILSTHSVQRRLHYDKNVSWKEPDHSDAVNEELLQDSLSFPQEKSVPLDNRKFWCNKASAYKGKNYRIIFEENMEKIYRNMYRNAADPNAYRKSQHSKKLM
ncbi:spermatogenesis-associated protein 6 isoform X2 [Phyllobates terribilis]|uniref:spermatogenesis-associated protein 6 isoform X2 n=1 Tax=Phyllobates terribilis TaxID=111132 RepID=UPI003CCA9519